ncbi:FadR/GntR family transcriptional regulator [Rhodococcus sp. 14-1411-2a]|uniref:FadR/GntR family transcriptional regulator n=1 Tax=Rhodococcus sp. 14-1411-2a TaxID=2023151 RepID=UPI000B9B93A4|nr:FadR/GntR family transcriptional regulator [Rhodococcus sp. 14-1411-2a]OZF52913.1 GntR family transcriptional regulator [Rhodococcus sp. 14-1411-2a]
MSVTDGAIEKIKGMIVSGKLKPGSRLPRESDLAAELGVSRNSLREAVRALSLVRLLDVRQGDGTFVASLEPQTLLDTVSFLLELHQDDSVLDILAVRRILEPGATALAAHNMTTDDIALLHDMLLEQESGTITDLVAHDLEFHAAIAVGSGNRILSSLLESISLPTARARVWRGLTEENAFARTIAEHRGIFEAIVARDSGLAHARAMSHIAGVEEWLRRAHT